MTSKICSVKKHPVVNFFKFTLKKQTPLTLLVTAFTLLFCPGMILSEVNDNHLHNYSLSTLEFGTISAVLLGAALALVCMILLLNFGFLFSKKAGDMFNSLPFTRNELLLTRSLGAFIGGFFLMSVAYFGLVIVNFLPTVDGVGIVAVINTYLFMVLSLIVLTAFCLLFGICCGGYFDTVIAFATINIAPVVILALILGVAEQSVTGIYFDYNMLIYLTPIAFAFNKILFLPSVIERPEAIYTMAETTSVYTVIGLIVLGVLCVFFAIKLFGVRKSETAGEAYSFKFMPIIISLLVSIVGGFLIASALTGFNLKFNLAFWVFFVICAILCGVAIGAIINRSFKYVKTFVINGIIASAVMTALVIGSLYIAGYAEVKIPKADDVETVYIGDIEFKENIDLAIKLHSGIIENLDEEEYIEDRIYPEIYPEVVYNFNNFDFEYIMKNGSTIKRNYWYNQRTMEELNPDILALMQTDEYLNQFDIIVETAKDQGIVSIYSFATKFGTLEDDGHQKIAILNQKDAKEFIYIFKKEMKSADISVFKEEAYGVEMAGEIYLNLYIPESFTGTIDYLEGKFLSQTEQTD